MSFGASGGSGIFTGAGNPDWLLAAVAATAPLQRQDGGDSPNIAFEPLDFQDPAAGTNTNQADPEA